jgi:hypothetical protein
MLLLEEVDRRALQTLHLEQLRCRSSLSFVIVDSAEMDLPHVERDRRRESAPEGSATAEGGRDSDAIEAAAAATVAATAPEESGG